MHVLRRSSEPQSSTPAALVVALLFAAACASEPPEPLSAPPPTGQAFPAPAVPGTASAPVPGTASPSVPGTASAPADAVVPEAAGKADPFAGTSFPPPAGEPMWKRTAKPGDGEWQPLAEFAGEGGPVQVTTVHPHKIKPFVFVTVLAFDRSKVDLKLVAGTQEPASDAVPSDQRSGLVPMIDHSQLMVVFNGGFKARHGNYGMMADGVEYVPPKEDACGLALFKDGHFQVGSWPTLANATNEMVAWRQTPPCLVEKGERNPRLKTEFSTRKWGAAQGGARDIRRSAFGVEPSGRTWFYAFGDWVSAGELADAMIAVGAQNVAQLDINWSYTRLFLFESQPSGPPQIGRTLIPKLKYSKTRYTTKPSYRDFFYVKRKAPN